MATKKTSSEEPSTGANGRRAFFESKKLSVNMSTILYDRLSNYSMKSGREMAEIIRAAIDDFLDQRGC